MDGGSTSDASGSALSCGVDDGGGVDDGSAAAFIGAWTCNLTITHAEADGADNLSAAALVITGCRGGGVEETFSLLDGGFIYAATASVSGDTATLSPNQSTVVNSQTITFQSGTATVDGGTLTLSETFINSGSCDAADDSCSDVLQNASGTCTRPSFACAQPPDPAPLVQDMASCDAPPTPAGGTPADGTYYLTSAVEYPGDAGCSETLSGHSQGTIVVRGGELSIVVVNGENPAGANGGWEIATSPSAANGFSSTCVCGTFSGCAADGGGQGAVAAGDGGLPSYTATADSILVFPTQNPSPSTPLGVFTFAKQ